MNYKKKAILVVTALFCLNFAIFAQSVSLKMSNVSVKQAMNGLKTNSGYSFVFAAGDVNTKMVISVQATQLDEAIKQILDGQNLTYEIKGKNIILMKKPAQQGQGSANPSRKVSGVVTDFLGEPVIGATVIVKGNEARGIITDLDGRFTLEVPEDGSIEISYIGYTSQTISVKGKSSLSVKLKDDSKLLEEVVVVGYTTQKKGLLTGSVVTLKMTEALGKMSTTSPANLLAGQLAGVNVGTADGIPGNNPSISIRTGSSWNKQPILYVIDGTVRTDTDFNNLSPNEIEDITVLKDAASAAVYGARSEGGVILVTTKRGQVGKPKFSYSYSYGVDTRTPNMDLTDAVQTGEIYNRVFAGQNKDWFWTEEEFDYIRTINGGWGYDHLEEVWENPNIQTHNLSMTGGAEKVKYFAGVSYTKQQGFLKPLGYDKFNFRLNTTIDATDKLQFFASMSLTDNIRKNAALEGAGGFYPKLLKWQPDQPLRTNSGEYMDYDWYANIAAELNGKGGYDKSRNIRPQMSLSATYQLPLEGLSIKASYASSWKHDRQNKFVTQYDLVMTKRSGQYGHIRSTDDADIVKKRKSTNTGKDKIEKTSWWNNDYQANIQLNYNRTFKEKHSVSGALVFEKSELTEGSVKGGRETFPIYLKDEFWAASDRREDTWGGGDTEQTTGRASFIGQFNYSYASKYLVNFSFREDGSMKFVKDNRWGFFPAASVGWVVSEENFFNKEKIEFLKLRVSGGVTGNDDVGGWAWQEVYKGGNSAYFGKTPVKNVGLKYGDIANTALTWEKSLSYNAGVDMHFLNHWSATVEYWFRNTYDILGARKASVPTSFSLAMPKENYGEVHAQGFDFTLGYQNKWGEFDFRSQLTMSYGWNKVIVEDYAENAMPIDIPIGRSRSNHKGYRFDQILRTQEQLDQFNEAHPGYRIGGITPQLGMMVYKDVSGKDGIPDGIIDSWDKVFLEENNFPINYGLSFGGNWKGLSLDMMFNGQLAYKKSFKGITDGPEHNRMYVGWHSNSWTSETPNAWLPRQVDKDKTYTEDSDFWLTDASFIRLKYVNLGYTIPTHLYKGVFDRVKLFFSGNNLFVLSHFKYWDPERGNGFEYPAMRSFNFGIDVTF